MNERIKQLCEQSKEYADKSTKDFTGDEPVCWMDYYTEKFAELIVKECIYTIQLQMVRNSNNTPENIRSYQHINALGAKFGITFPMDYSG